jgi:CubicO group peptidase (beta-lactamase class C family)
MLRKFRSLLLLMVIIAMTMVMMPIYPLRAQSQTLDTKEIEAYINEMMVLYNVEGVGIALVKDDKVVFAKGFGQRSAEPKQPATENTLFLIGSITKSFTSLAVAQLVDQGKLNLDDPVIKYVPDLKLADPALTKTVTIRHLLSHTSGLPRADEHWYANPPASRQQVIDDMAKVKPTAKPGEKWQYHNQNFVLAAHIVEKVTGQTWEDYVRKNIFEPLGMKSAGFNVSDLQKATDYSQPFAFDVLKGNVALSFDRLPFKGLVPIGPAGSITANVLDMAQYMRLQLGNGTFEGKQLVSEKMIGEMHRKHIALQPEGLEALMNASPLTTDMGYGLGWVVENYRGHKLVQHNGGIDGFTSMLTLVPSEKAGVIILTNISGEIAFTETVRLRMIEYLLGLKSEKNIAEAINKSAKFDPVERRKQVEAARAYKPDPAALEKLAGEYDSPQGKMTLVAKDGKLIVQLPINPLELVPYSADGFLLNGNSFSLALGFTFKTDAEGTTKMFLGDIEFAQRLGKDVKAVEYKDSKGRFTVALPAGIEAQPAETESIAVFKMADPAATLRIGAVDAKAEKLEDDVKQWVTTFRPGFDLKPLSVNDAPLPNGVTWTQYLYSLPDNDLLVVLVTKKGSTLYFVSAQAKLDAAQRLSLPIVNLLQAFKIS